MKLRMAIALAVLSSLPGLAQSVQEKAWSVLDAGAKEKSADKRTQAVRAVGVIVPDARAAALAQAALDDPQPAVREAAAAESWPHQLRFRPTQCLFALPSGRR